MKTLKWGSFVIGDVFNINTSNSGATIYNMNPKGIIPYVSSSSLRNGVKLFIDEKQKSRYKMDTGNVITIASHSQTIFYHPYDFYTAPGVQILSHKNLTKNIALFLIPLLHKQIKKFSWGGNAATYTRIKRTKIILPINNKGEIDWEFMESYIKEKYNKSKEKLEIFFKERING